MTGPDDGAAQVIWVGHGTVLVEVAGRRLLIDPVLTQRVAHLRRRHPRPPADLRRVDVVVISHAHRDHLHLRSLRLVGRTSPGVPVVVPRGAARYVADLGLGPATEVEAGESLTVGGFDLSITEATHKGGRGARHTELTGTVGFLTERAGKRVYLAGDTDLYDGMVRLGRLDLAALPIAGWWRKLGPGHLDAERAAEAVARLDPTLALPIHWGTLAPENLSGQPGWLSEPGRRFAAALAERGLADRLLLLPPGGDAAW